MAGQSTHLNISASDHDDNASLTYAITGVPVGATLSSASHPEALQYNAQTGVYSVSAAALADLTFNSHDSGAVALNVTVTNTESDGTHTVTAASTVTIDIAVHSAAPTFASILPGVNRYAYTGADASSGYVTGIYNDTNGSGSHGFLYNHVTGTITVLDENDPSANVHPTAVNALGEVAGNFYGLATGYGQQAFLYAGGAYTTIQLGFITNATTLSADGIVGGNYRNGDGNTYGFIDNAGHITNLPIYGVDDDIFVGFITTPMAIGAGGSWVTGYTDNGIDNNHEGWVYSSGHVTYLNAPDAGHLAGKDVGGTVHGFVYSSDAFHEFDAPAGGHFIDTNGWWRWERMARRPGLYGRRRPCLRPALCARRGDVVRCAGDLEGAISALERMLLINGNLPRVRLELGVLYYRLGSYGVAHSYLDTVLNSQALPPEVRSRAEQFMAEIRKKQSPSSFSGEVFGGVRYQSNANLGPPTSSVRLFGQVANLNQASIGAADWGVISSGSVRHTYDFGGQDRGALETQLNGYMSRQFQLSAANVSLLDLTSGPRLQVFQGSFEDVSLKPFATLGYIWVNDASYYGSYGSGLEAGALISDRLRNTSTVVWRRQLHPDNAYLPTNSQLTGTEYSASTAFQYQLTDIVSLIANGNIQRYITDNTPWQNYQLYGFGGGMQFRFADPLFKSQLAWSVALTANLQWWSYDQADVTVDPTMGRSQNDTILNLTLAVPFDERTTFTVSGGRFVRAANIPNYQFENNSFLMGVSWRF